MPWHSFQEEFFCDLTGYRGEADWSVVPASFFLSFLNISVIFPFFQPQVTSPNCDYLSSMMETGFETALVKSLGPWNVSNQVSWSCVLSATSDGFKSDLQQLVGLNFPSPCLVIQGLKRCGKNSFWLKLRQNVLEYLSLPHVHCH